jgi:uncharacterized protein involved in exopolysaccharide biosynthesis
MAKKLDDITEFVEIDVDRIDLVGIPANGVPTPVLAKQAATPAVTDRKENRKMSKLQKRLRKAMGVNLAGAASTAADRQSDKALTDLLRQSTSQTRSNAEGNRRALRQIYAAFDGRVAAAEKAVRAAGADEFAKARALQERRSALRSRLMAKMVVAERTGSNKSQYPNSVAIFGRGDACTTHTIGDDPQVRGY